MCIASYRNVLDCDVLHCMLEHCMVLQCIALYCNVVSCIHVERCCIMRSTVCYVARKCSCNVSVV